MRKHDVYSQIDSKVPAEHIQKEVNIYTVLYIKQMLGKSGLPKEVQIDVIDKLIEYVRTNSTNN